MTSGDNATKVLGWAKEEAPFVHGYWEWDWADSIQAIVGAAQNGSSVDVELPAGHSSKQHARFFGLNLKSELDAPNEYYIEASSARSTTTPRSRSRSGPRSPRSPSRTTPSPSTALRTSPCTV